MTTKKQAEVKAKDYAYEIHTKKVYENTRIKHITNNRTKGLIHVVTDNPIHDGMFKYDPPRPVYAPGTIGWVTCPGSKELRVLHSQEGQKYIVYGPGQFRIGPTYEVFNFTPLTEKDLNIKKDDGDKKRIKSCERCEPRIGASCECCVNFSNFNPINKPFVRKTECIDCINLYHEHGGNCNGNTQGTCEAFKSKLDNPA